MLDCRAQGRYLTMEEVTTVFARASSVIKLTCGIANNAAMYVMLDAHDKIKAHPRYKHETKRAFKAAIARWKVYEAGLVNPTGQRFFCLEDMSPSVRKKYGDITDRQYYDFWADMGGEAYQRTRPLVTSLWNKFRLSLLQHGVRNADSVAWVMTAETGLEIAAKVWRHGVEECAKEYGLPPKLMRQVFAPFDISPVQELWKKALYTLAPEIDEYDLESTERRNIDMGLRQLEEAWVHPETIYASATEAVKEYDEVFRTPGEQKKAARELGEIYDDIMNDL